jgi:hypothetical protein
VGCTKLGLNTGTLDADDGVKGECKPLGLRGTAVPAVPLAEPVGTMALARSGVKLSRR